MASASIPCRACAAPIRFVLTENGRSTPIDAEPVLVGGSIRIVEGIATVVPAGERDAAGPLYVSHFSTCPAASGFRKTRGRK